MKKKTSFIDCKYRREEYCINPIRNKKTNWIALLFCLESKCTYDVLKNSGDMNDR